MANRWPIWTGLILSPIILVALWMTNRDVGNLFGGKTSGVEHKITLRSINYVPTKGTSSDLSSGHFYTLSGEEAGAAGATKKTLAEYAGKPIILHFWATWCGACVDEMPEFAEFAAKHSEDVHIIAIAHSKISSQDVRRFYEENKIKSLSIFVDEGGAFSRSMGVASLPTTVFVSAKSRELGRIEGPVEWMSGSGMFLTKYIKSK